MTPVASLGGLPGSLVGAVRLEPEGLVLNKAATLSIQPLGGGPVAARLAPFTAEGDGDDLHLLPDPDGGLTVSLLHFSIPGIGDMSADQQAQTQAQQPARSQAQYESDLRDAVKRGNTVEQIEIAKGYYRDVVKPALLPALTSDDAMNAAFATGMSWQRTFSLLGLDAFIEAEVDEMYDLFKQILQNAADRAYTRCVNDHDLTAITRMLQIQRWSELLGFATDADYADVVEKIDNCLRFEVDFESSVDEATGDVHGRFDYHLRSLDTMLTLAGPGGGISGDGPLTWLEHSGLWTWT